MQVFVTGATGFVGSSLCRRLLDEGHQVSAWVRNAASAAERLGSAVQLVATDGGQAALQAAIDNADAVVNLAGEPIFPARWSEEKRKRVLASRIGTTEGVAQALAARPAKEAAESPDEPAEAPDESAEERDEGPGESAEESDEDPAESAEPGPVLISASAIGYYGDRGDEELSEESAPGEGFLSEVCVGWEGAAAPAQEAGVRVVFLRFGVILDASDGPFPRLRTLFKSGLGGRIGSGKQYFPWVHLDDVIQIIVQALEESQMRGAYNVVAPQAVTNQEFTAAMGTACSRPTLFPVPAFVLRTMFGEASVCLLGSQRGVPARLMERGYVFRHPTLEGALGECVG